MPSPASGFTYKFDPSTGTFVRSTKSFGPILTDRGETIGRGRIALGTNLQFFSFDRLDGVALSDVPAIFRHDDYRSTGGRSDVIATRNTIQATVTQFTGALTYGVTDRIDISAAVPVVRTRISLLSNATIHRVGTGDRSGGALLPRPGGPRRSWHVAPVLRRWGSRRHRRHPAADEGHRDARRARSLAAGVDLRLPTGDELNLLGSGAPGVRPFAALSGSFGVASPHLNVAYQWNGRSVLAGDVREA